MVFDTKVAILVLEDLAVWQKLNVTAFLATGIAGAAPEAMGEPYEDAASRRFAPPAWPADPGVRRQPARVAVRLA
jgi:hypothetical protein